MKRESIAVGRSIIPVTLFLVALLSSIGLSEDAPATKPDPNLANGHGTEFQIPERFIRQARRAAAREAVRRRDSKHRRPTGLKDVSAQGEIGRVIERAIARFRNPDYAVQRLASEQLRYLSDLAFDELVKGAFSDHVQTAINCGGLLEHLGKRGVTPLINVAQNHKSPTIRMFVISSLSRAQEPVAIPVLIELLKDESAQVRAAAAGAIRWFRDIQTVAPLELAAKDPKTGNAAKAALKELRSPTRAPSWPRKLLPFKQLCNDAWTIKGEAFGPTEIEAITRHLDHENSTVAGAAMLALGKLDARSALPQILSNRSAPYRMSVLVSIPAPEALDAVIDAVESASLPGKPLGLHGLTEGGRWTVPLLIAALDDPKLRIPAHTENYFGFQVRWPAGHKAHSTLHQLLFRFDLPGETINLYRTNGRTHDVDAECRRLREWWRAHGDNFLAGDDVPNPKVTSVGYEDP